MRKLLLMILLSVTLLLTSLTGCAYVDKARQSVSEAIKPSISSQFDVEVINIATYKAIKQPDNPNTAWRQALFVQVSITPKNSYAGGTPICLAYFAKKDNHYFGHTAVITWTQDQLRLPDPSERDLNKINAMEQQRTKITEAVFPLSDIDVDAFLDDLNVFDSILFQNRTWYDTSDIIHKLSGGADMDNIRSIFNRYFTLKIVTQEEAIELEKTEPMPTPTQNTQPKKPSISLISPNGGEVWHIGDKVTIRWSSINYTDKIYIQLSYDGGKTWVMIIPQTANTGSQEWMVTGEASPRCRIKIFGVGNNIALVPDPAESAADFTMSTQ